VGYESKGVGLRRIGFVENFGRDAGFVTLGKQGLTALRASQHYFAWQRELGVLLFPATAAKTIFHKIKTPP